jgi:hypothetical protein
MTSKSSQETKILPKHPSNYRFLTELTKRPNLSEFRPRKGQQVLFPVRKPRIAMEFKTEPFPHNEKIVLDIQDDHLMFLKSQSRRRREGYPKIGHVEIRQGELPDILNPNYQPRPIFPKINGKIALPQPSMLQKPLRVHEYEEMMEKSKPSNLPRKITLEKASSSTSISVDDHVYFQHVRQPDFSDFDRMMIQKPVIIYMQKRKAEK